MATATADTADVPDYYAGLLDAQLGVNFRAKSHVRVTLTSADRRVASELSGKFDQPNRVTTVETPGKKSVCTVVYTDDAARNLLKFASEHCVLKKKLAEETLKFMDGKATAEDVVSKTNDLNIPDKVSVPWASGYFDVRGTVMPPVYVHGDRNEDDSAIESSSEDHHGDKKKPTKKKKKRGTIKLILPKSEKGVLPLLKEVLHGKVKKSSPCRLVFESKDMIRQFVDTVGDHVRVKKEDLDAVAEV
jgi:hypothetical protein